MRCIAGRNEEGNTQDKSGKKASSPLTNLFLHYRASSASNLAAHMEIVS